MQVFTQVKERERVRSELAHGASQVGDKLMGWQRNRNARISGDSSAAREVREKTCSNQVGQKKEKKIQKMFFQVIPIKKKLVLSIISSYPHFSAAFWGS